MAVKLGDVFVNITGDSSQLDKELDSSRRKVSAFGGVLQGILQGVGQRLFDATSGAVRKLAGAIVEATDKASDLGESVNKTGVVFGKSAREILDWSKTTDTALGQSQREALEAAAGFGNLFTSLGVARKEAAGMSIDMVELASDLASLNNIDPSEALEKLRAGLVGETEPLRTVGVFLNETVVASKAAELGFGKVGTKLTEQQKVLARYALILGQTKNAQGDFARTSDELANATRITTAQFENLQTTFGQAFLPIKTAFVRGLGEIITAIQPFAGRIVQVFAQGLTAAVRFVTPALMVLRQLFVHWLKPGSPPRLLPELIDWGMAAANEWIKGWTKADFGGLEQLGSSIESILRSFVSSGQIGEGDLVNRVLGSRSAIAEAIAEFRQFGQISQDTLQRIISSAGPAGDGIAGLVDTYFDLQRASEAVSKAQQDLNDVTKKYDDIISPLQARLDELSDRQNEIRDQKRLIELQKEVADSSTDALDRESARIEIDQILLRKQIANKEKEKDAAVDTSQAALDAAEQEQQAAQDKFDASQALLQQQIDRNNLIGEEMALEERVRKEREAAAQQAQAQAEALSAAVLQYQLGLADTGGKLQILRGELAKTQVGSIEYFNLLGQIHDLEQQAAEEAKAKAEQIADAQLAYRLQLADTQGDLVILRGELAKTQTGSAEYYQLLTQIAAKEQEIINERATGGMPELPVVPGLENPGGLDPFDNPETKKAIADLVKAIGDIGTTAVTITPSVQHLADAIGNIIENAGLLFGIDFSSFEKSNSEVTIKSGLDWQDYARNVEQQTAAAKAATDKMADDTAKKLDVWASNIRLVTLAAQGHWAAFWIEFARNTQLGTEASNQEAFGGTNLIQETFNNFFGTALAGWKGVFTAIAQSFTDFITQTQKDWGDFLQSLSDIGQFATDMFNAGGELLGSLWDGMKAKWSEISDWWSGPNGVWTGFRNVLPFSEPKDPSSPLRGLDKAGESIMEQIQKGFTGAALNVQPLAQAVGGNTSNFGPVVFNQQFGANADIGQARQASRQGLLDARRAMGL